MRLRPERCSQCLNCRPNPGLDSPEGNLEFLSNFSVCKTVEKSHLESYFLVWRQPQDESLRLIYHQAALYSVRNIIDQIHVRSLGTLFLPERYRK